MFSLTQCLILSLLFIYSYVSSSGENKCDNKTTCKDCIKSPDCKWCDKINSTNFGGCLYKEVEEDICLGNITNPKSMIHNTISATSGLMNPQTFDIHLRPSEAINISFTYTPKTAPMDLYVLLDNSLTMSEHTKQIHNLADTLLHSLKDTNVWIGLGTFEDKSVLPFGAQTGKSFVNVLPLKTRTTDKDKGEFSDATKNMGLGNYDNPEGILEAIVQATVCEKQIGWRQNTTRILLVATDNTFHLAGDGKLAGIIKPNDGQCHLEGNVYTYDGKQDYPSIEQAHKLAREKNIFILYAIALENNFKEYSKVIKNRDDIKLELLDSTTNVTNIIDQWYRKIITSGDIKDDFVRPNITVTYHSNCSKLQGHCRAVEGDVINYTAEIKLINCEDKLYEKSFKIHPLGSEFGVEVHVKMLCECECEKAKENSMHDKEKACNDNGYLMCGGCTCESPHYGDKCQCSRGNGPTNSSGCVEAKECNPCPERNGVTCGGEENKCNCGKCICGDSEKYGGATCECDKTNCIHEGKVCNGHGDCDCDSCKCNDQYFGLKCEHCPECCSNYTGCVQCLYQGKSREDCNCEEHEIKILDDKKDFDENSKGQLCTTENDGCTLHYKFIVGEDNKNVISSVYVECPILTAQMKWIFASALITILFIGLITILIWKAATTMMDRREYAKFEAMTRAQNSFELNPLFKPAETKFQNPMYGK